MTGPISIADREQREKERLARYRGQFVRETPSWYRGELMIPSATTVLYLPPGAENDLVMRASPDF